MSAPSSASSNTTVCIWVMIPGQQVSPVSVDRHASIATLLDAIQMNLVYRGLPTEFKAYTTKRGGSWIDGNTPEYKALVIGDYEQVAAKYLTPAALLDPTKTVLEYFGDAPLEYTVHVMLEWSPAAKAEYEDRIARLSDLWTSRTKARHEARVRLEAREQLLEANRLRNARGSVVRRLNRPETCDGYE